MTGPDANIRALSPGDVPAACAFVAAAGWNQTEADWRLMLAQGAGFCVDADGEIAATAIALPYQHFGWISMMLVSARHRRKGYATLLLARCVEWLQARGMAPVLDATPDGREVYRQHGFRDAAWFTRLTSGGASTLPAGGGAVSVRPIAEADWPAIAAFDRPAFGDDRSSLLQAIAQRRPELALLAECGGEIAGFVLARDGRVATQLGPLAAGDDETAIALLRQTLGATDGPVYLDAADRHPASLQWLQTAGFTAQRPLIRMVHGSDLEFGDPALIYAAAGPELG